LTMVVIFSAALILSIPRQISIPKKQSKSQLIITNKKTFPKTYITKEGDFLWQIAESNYGSGFNAYDIAKANNLVDPNNIPPGTRLILPSVKIKEPTKGEISSIQSGQVVYKQDRYIVKPGDSLSKIALEVYGDLNAWPTIAKANNLPNAEAIEVGMILIIPR